MKIIKYFLMVCLIANQVIYGMEQVDSNAISSDNYITIELAGNKEAQMLTEEFVSLCEQSITVQNHIAEMLNQNTIVNSEGKLTIDVAQLPQNYPLYVIDEDTFAELISYIVYGKISESIQDDCLCKLIKIANYLDMPQLLKEGTQLLAERAVSDETLTLLLNKDTFENYYQQLAIGKDIETKELISKIANSKFVKECLLHIMPEKKKEFTLNPKDCFPIIAISPDSSFIVLNYGDSILEIIDLEGNLKKTIDVEKRNFSIGISSDNKIITCDSEGCAKIWDQAGNLFHKQMLQVPINDYITSEIHANSSTIVTCFENKLVIWNALTGAILQRYSLPSRVSAVAISNDGKLVAVPCWDEDRTICLIEIERGKWRTLETCRIFNDKKIRSIPQISFNADNSAIVAGCWASGEGCLFVYDIKSNNHYTLKSILFSSSHFMYKNLNVSSNNLFISVLDKGATIKIIALNSKSMLHDWKLNCFGNICLSPNDEFIISATADGKVQLWDLHKNFLNGLSLKQVHIVILILSKKVSLNNLPNHLQEVYETLPQEVKTALNSIK